MVQLYVYSFITGAVATAGVPHFVRGISGEKFQTPFGNPSSALVNVVFGWVCFVVAGFVLHFAHPRTHQFRALAAIAVGSLVIALLMSNMWARKPSKG